MSLKHRLPEADAARFPRTVEPTELLQRVARAPRTVLFLPSIGFDIDLLQRPHHLARAFARQGILAIFDSSNSHDPVEGLLEIAPDLMLFRGELASFASLPNLTAWAVPYNVDRCRELPAEAKIVYDWIDDLAVFPHDRALLERNHSWALEHADVVTSVAMPLHQQALARRPDALYLPNGVEYELFADASAAPPADEELTALLAHGRPIAAYYGALARWFDYGMLASAARRRPDWSFLLIGPRLDDSGHGQELFELSNVAWLGPRSYFTLPGYLAAVDVALIPFAINEITLATSPLKLYEYLAAGKPVVAAAMPECQATPGVLIAHDGDELATLLDEAKERGRQPSYRAAAAEIGRGASWDARAACALRALEAAPDRSPRQLLERRFAHLRRPAQRQFFARVCDHAASWGAAPGAETYVEYALSSLERGQRAVALARRHRAVAGCRYLDIGCAYGGFVAAFAQAGAHATGVELSPHFAALAAVLLDEQDVQAELIVGDATERRPEWDGRFDLVTANDVLEHVEDMDTFLANVAQSLRPGGHAFLEVPNGRHPPFVVSDGHYQLFGITLLGYAEAHDYFMACGAPGAIDTYNYPSYEEYRRRFAAAGLSFEILPETFDDVELAGVESALERLVGHRDGELPDAVPQAWRALLRRALVRYLDDLAAEPRETAGDRRRLLLSVAPAFWRILARPLGASSPC